MEMLLLGNPRRRKKGARSARKARRGRRTMTAKQLKFFGPRKARRASSRRRARRSVPATMFANPVRRSRRSRRASSSRRRYRRNPISLGGIKAGAMRLSASSVVGAVKGAAVGAVGAVGVDIAMGYAGRVLPASVTARYNAQGGMNPGYYIAKSLLAIGFGVLGAKVLPGKLKGVAAKMAEGSLTVQGYEILRGMVPASIMLGYYSPARITPGAGLTGARGRMGAYLTRGARPMARLAASFPAGSMGTMYGVDARIGEGAVT